MCLIWIVYIDYSIDYLIGKKWKYNLRIVILFYYYSSKITINHSEQKQNNLHFCYWHFMFLCGLFSINFVFLFCFGFFSTNSIQFKNVVNDIIIIYRFEFCKSLAKWWYFSFIHFILFSFFVYLFSIWIELYWIEFYECECESHQVFFPLLYQPDIISPPVSIIRSSFSTWFSLHRFHLCIEYNKIYINFPI